MLQFGFRGDIHEGKTRRCAELCFNEILRAAFIAVCLPTDNIGSVGEGFRNDFGGNGGIDRRRSGIAHIETELLFEGVGDIGVGGERLAAKTGLDIGILAREFEGGGSGFGGFAGSSRGEDSGVNIGFEDVECGDVGGDKTERNEIGIGNRDEVAEPYGELGVVGGIEVCHRETLLFA